MALQAYEKLNKLPAMPAQALVNRDKIPLEEPLEQPGVPINVALAQLAERELLIDALMLWSYALPPREGCWWACLAARDIAGLKPADKAPSPLAEAEAWVFKPSDEVRAQIAEVLKTKDDDPFGNCARAALFSDGTAGPYEMAEAELPPGTASLMVYSVVAAAYMREAEPEPMAKNGAALITSALDIAKGGSGRVAQEASA